MNKFKLLIFSLSLLLTTTFNCLAITVPDNFSSLVEELMPSVVNISTTQKITRAPSDFRSYGGFFHNDDFSEFLEKFGFVPPGTFSDNGHGGGSLSNRRAVSLGSGFIVDAEGYIATNKHVIDDAEEIIVNLHDNKEYKAKIVGYDSNTDLALLKINAGKPLVSVKFGDSNQAKVGEWVIAIGNQLGLGGTVTVGIISAKSRDINAKGIVDNFIQTDAAINKGSSGGPMFNTKGEVIGVNTAIITPSEGNVGIALATPSSLAKKVIQQLKKTGKVQRAWLGVKIQQVDDEIAQSLGLEGENGALIAEVTKNSPADKAGLKPYDIILSFDGKEINKNNKLPRIVAETELTKKVEIIYLRKGERKIIHTFLEEMKNDLDDAEQDNLSDNAEKNLENGQINGIIVSKISKQLRQQYGIDPEINGCLITKISSKGLWVNKGLKKGDVIVAVNQEYISSPKELKEILDKAKKQKRKTALLLINRSKQLNFVTMPIMAPEKE